MTHDADPTEILHTILENIAYKEESNDVTVFVLNPLIELNKRQFLGSSWSWLSFYTWQNKHNINKLNDVVVFCIAHIGQSLQERFELAVSVKSKAIGRAVKLIC